MQAVLFDLDETLSDRSGSLSRFAQAFLEQFALDLDVVSAGAIEDAICQADGDGYRPRDEVFGDLLEVLPWRVKRPVNDLRVHWHAVFPRCAAPMPGLHTVLDTLRASLRMGIITNGGTRVQNLKIDTLGLRPYMDTILVSEAVGLAKPDHRIFHRALADLKV